MIAWWSWTFLSLTTRWSGRLSSACTYSDARPVLRVVADDLRGRLDLGDHVAGQEARVGTRVGERLVLLVEALGRAERAFRGEAVERVRVALERREVVEELRQLALLFLLQLRDLARALLAVLDDRGGLGLVRKPFAAEVAARVEALAGGGELRPRRASRAPV